MGPDAREIRTTTAGGGEEDRISSLPDEIIHQILSHLRSPNEAAKATVLSKRWTGIWRSYPILEYTVETNQSQESVARFIAAATAKFSGTLPMDAVRIAIGSRAGPMPRPDYPFHDLLQLVAETKSLPQEIEIKYNCAFYPLIIPQTILPPSQFRRVRVLNLENCELETRYLNNILAAAASNLQSLTVQGVTLDWAEGIPRLRIRDLTRLKVLRVKDLTPEDLEITGKNTLETLDLSGFPLRIDFKASLIPNLREVRIHKAEGLTDKKLNKLISASPSLESLAVLNPPRKVRKLKIGNRARLREFRLEIWQTELPAVVIEVDDALRPRRRNFYYAGRVEFCPRIVVLGGSVVDGDTVRSSSSFDWDLDNLYKYRVSFNELRWCLENLSQFRVTLRFRYQGIFWVDNNEVRNNLHVVRIEQIVFPTEKTGPPLHENAFVDNFFQTCHPKYLSFSIHNNVLFLEAVRKRFKEKNFTNHCKYACSCWRHQLKDAKIVIKRGIDNISNTQDEGTEVVDVSTISLYDIETTQILLLLTWK